MLNTQYDLRFQVVEKKDLGHKPNNLHLGPKSNTIPRSPSLHPEG